MASKYGRQLYGKDYYSSAITDLAGDVITLAPGFSGVLQKIKDFISALPLSVTVNTSAMQRIKDVIATFSADPTFSGIIVDVNQFIGSIDVIPVFSGDLSRAGVQAFEGSISVSPVISGAIAGVYPFIGSISIIPAVSGDLVRQRLHALEGLISVAPTFSGVVVDINQLTGSVSIVPIFSGTIVDTNQLTGLIDVIPVFSGDLTRQRFLRFEGMVLIEPELVGDFVNSSSLDESTMHIELTFFSDEFIGPFWNPTPPSGADWGASGEPDGPPWVPTDEFEGPPWVPTL